MKAVEKEAKEILAKRARVLRPQYPEGYEDEAEALLAKRRSIPQIVKGSWINCDLEHYQYTSVVKGDRVRMEQLDADGWTKCTGQEYREGFDADRYETWRQNKLVREVIQRERHERLRQQPTAPRAPGKRF